MCDILKLIYEHALLSAMPNRIYNLMRYLVYFFPTLSYFTYITNFWSAEREMNIK